MNDLEDGIRLEQFERTQGAGYVSRPEQFEIDLARTTKKLQAEVGPAYNVPRERVLKFLLAVYQNPVAHRRWNADGADDGTPKGRVLARLGNLQVDFQEAGDEEAEDFLLEMLDLVDGRYRTATERHLRHAVGAELTHGGIIDRIAHETSIIGAWARVSGDVHENMQNIRESAGRLDTARNEYIERMTKALEP